MKIDENLLNKEYKRVYTNFDEYPFYPNGSSDDVLIFSSIFTQKGEPETFICSVIKGLQ
jgi:hypothetical protein